VKCISLWQPWATLMVIGAKRNETRSWPTSHRGVIAIHAAKKWTHELADMCLTEPFLDVLKDEFSSRSAYRSGGAIPLGVIVGTVEIVGCKQITEENRPSGNERAFGDYTPGRFGWQARNPVRFAEPIPFRGAQGFFEVPDSLLLAPEART